MAQRARQGKLPSLLLSVKQPYGLTQQDIEKLVGFGLAEGG
jgi:hypothetical protein